MMTEKLSSLKKVVTAVSVLAAILGTTKESLAQNLANSGNNKAQTEVTAKINKLNIDPFDRVKTFVDQSNPVEVEHYNRLLETGLAQKESYILGLKTALLALHNDPTISAQDKKILALIVFEDGINLPPGTPNRGFYNKKNQQRLENDEMFFDLCVKFGEMQNNIIGMIADKESIELIKQGKQLDEKGKQLDEKGKQLDEKGKQLDEKGKQLDEKGKQLDEKGKQLDEKIAKGKELDEKIAKGKEKIAKGKEDIAKLNKEIALLEQILKTFQDANK